MYLYDEVDHRHMTRAVKLTLKAVYFLGPQWRALAPQAEPSRLRHRPCEIDAMFIKRTGKTPEYQNVRHSSSFNCSCLGSIIIISLLSLSLLS